MTDISLSAAFDPDSVLRELEALLGVDEPLLTQTANAVSLLYWSLERVNWLGFYLLHGEQLVLGPFQGKPACTRITLGSGVCGTAANENRTLTVPDVHTFPGHIICDPDSRSEVVVPLRCGERVWGVLDVDSPVPDRFRPEDVTMLEHAAAMIDLRMRSAEGKLFPLDTLC